MLPTPHLLSAGHDVNVSEIAVYDALLSFSMREKPECRQERHLLAPCQAYFGGNNGIAGGGGTHAGLVVSQQCHAAAEITNVATGNLGESAGLIDHVPHLVWTSDADGLVLGINARWPEFATVSPAGSCWTTMLHPDEREAATARWDQHCAGGEPYEAEHRLLAADGGERWMLARILPMMGDDGRVGGWCGSFTDIHALKTCEARSDFLVHELTHRLQNIFAVVESLLSLSSRNQPQAADFAAAAAARIRSLALANDYIRPQQGHAAHTSLHGLLGTLLAPYQPVAGAVPSVQIAGTDHPVGASSATLLAMVVHELATNAVKFGALSRASGRITVDTCLEDGLLHLVWTEAGGPPVAAPPAGRGFGTLLTERALRQPLAAQVERLWPSTGLMLKISVPCERLTN